MWGLMMACWESFQFTPLREGRRAAPPAWTLPGCRFQFTPLREGRPLRLWKLSRIRSIFQFTPLREGRPNQFLYIQCGYANFNSRPCVRGDWGYGKGYTYLSEFQFTPLREGRQSTFEWERVFPHFNSRPCVRGD